MSTDVLTRCPQCGTELAPGLLACPACGRLVHAERLKALAADADRLQVAGDLSAALGAWRAAADLLPHDSKQYAVVNDRIAELSRSVDTKSSTPAPDKPTWAGKAGVLGAIGLALWKFKFVLAFVLTKGKLLLLGLTKGGTFFSMLLSFGFYLSLWGWKLAAGIVLSIYIHEMGHVAMLRHFGIPATAPMFIPGLGAFIRTKYYPKDVVADARVGLAGPIWGLGAALASHGLFLVTREPIWSVIAHYGALINLFNLLPVWQLDGAHGFRALTRKQRWWAVGVIGAAWLLTHQGLLLALLLVAGWRAWAKDDTPEHGDQRALLEFSFLVLVLSLLTTLPVPTAS